MEKFSGEQLKQIRKEAGYTQVELAKLLRVHRDTIGHIENNKPGTIDEISADLIRRWWQKCSSRVSENTRYSFKLFIKKYFNV